MARGRLADDQRDELRRRYANGENAEDIAKYFNLHVSTVRKIGRRRIPKEIVPFDPTSVRSEGREQTYRENLNWAINAAGEHLRTKKNPMICPNDAAWFLYCQAIEEPKDFMQKVGQVESKAAEEDPRKDIVRSSRKTLEEIKDFLENLNEKAST